MANRCRLTSKFCVHELDQFNRLLIDCIYCGTKAYGYSLVLKLMGGERPYYSAYALLHD